MLAFRYYLKSKFTVYFRDIEIWPNTFSIMYFSNRVNMRLPMPYSYIQDMCFVFCSAVNCPLS